jgi:hypothetical protein
MSYICYMLLRCHSSSISPEETQQAVVVLAPLISIRLLRLLAADLLRRLDAGSVGGRATASAGELLQKTGCSLEGTRERALSLFAEDVQSGHVALQGALDRHD